MLDGTGGPVTRFTSQERDLAAAPVAAAMNGFSKLGVMALFRMTATI
jgi:hypothetical protein